MKRTSKHPNDKHAGQISFPGGALDPIDRSLKACAMRETMEEIGVPKSAYTWIGELTPLYIYVSKFLVFPFVAMTEDSLAFKKEDEEVERIISWPLGAFLESGSVLRKDLSIRNGTIRNVPYFNVSDDVLWGATAMVLSDRCQTPYLYR